jgi:hypothetical protein
MPYSPQDVLAPVLLGVTAFTAFMPSLQEVRAATEGTTVAKDVRTAEIAAGSVVLVTGLLIAMWSHEYYPLIISLLAVVGMVFLYENVLKMEPGI